MRTRRRGPSVLARATEPLSFADPLSNRIMDWGNDRLPWLWWPARPPSPRRPFALDEHAVYAAWTFGLLPVSLYASEWVLRRLDALPQGPRLWRDRSLQALATAVMWAETIGAWERRARRRRRLLG
jgi:hypothetical protein